MKKILYLLGINWNWIFQRPQIMALELEKNYEVTVVYPKKIIKIWKNQKKSPHLKNEKTILEYPLQDKIKILETLSNCAYKSLLKKADYYDVVWFGYPSKIDFLPDNYRGVIVYDCMDKHISMLQDEKQRKQLEKSERTLLDKADIILVSSMTLKKYVLSYVSEKKVFLIRNGILDTKCFPVAKPLKKDLYKIGYVGTIEKWFDYKPIMQSLMKNSDIEYHLIGPCLTSLKRTDRIIYEGVKEHSLLYSYVKDYDCLVMPFEISETIEAVDPVKLYEYISWGKCIISVYYPEIERFRDFVYFYSTPSEYESIMNKLKEKGFPPKYNREQQKKFLEENTWEKRGETVYSVIQEKIYEKRGKLR